MPNATTAIDRLQKALLDARLNLNRKGLNSDEFSESVRQIMAATEDIKAAAGIEP